MIRRTLYTGLLSIAALALTAALPGFICYRGFARSPEEREKIITTRRWEPHLVPAPTFPLRN